MSEVREQSNKEGMEKTLESPLDCKEIQPVHSEGDQPWDFFGRLEGVPGLPGAPQDEAGLTRKFETSHVGLLQRGWRGGPRSSSWEEVSERRGAATRGDGSEGVRAGPGGHRSEGVRVGPGVTGQRVSGRALTSDKSWERSMVRPQGHSPRRPHCEFRGLSGWRAGGAAGLMLLVLQVSCVCRLCVCHVLRVCVCNLYVPCVSYMCVLYLCCVCALCVVCEHRTELLC